MNAPALTYDAHDIACRFDHVPATPHNKPATLVLHLDEGETAWNPTDDAAPFVGPCRITYQRHHATTWTITDEGAA